MRDGKLLVELGAIVRGNVQGVGFRATTKFLAEELKLTGYVRNLPDGNVEIHAQGEKLQLEKLLSRLKNEFSSGYIETIDTTWQQVQRQYVDFRIV